MKYQSQQVAKLYFYGAMLVFTLQIVFGLLGAVNYVAPTAIPVEILPFSVVRMVHTNAPIVWLLLGFFGSAFFLLPEETEREIYRPMLAKIQFWIFLVAAVIVVVGYLFGNYDGRSYLEQPWYLKVGIVVVALMFLFNFTMTVLKGRRTVITNILMLGLWGDRRLLPVRLLPAGQHRHRQDVLVVGRASVGRGRVGAGDGLDPRLPDDQAHRRRSRGGREMALCHRRHGAVLRHSRHRPSLLLDRHAGLLAVDRHRSSPRWSRCRSSPWCCSPSRWCGKAGASTRIRRRCCGRSAAR